MYYFRTRVHDPFAHATIINPNNCTVRTGPNPFGESVRQFVLSRTDTVRVPSLQGAISKRDPQNNLVLITDGDPFLTELASLNVSSRVKSKQSRSDFAKAQSRGDIVLKPMLTSSLSIANQYLPDDQKPSVKTTVWINDDHVEPERVCPSQWLAAADPFGTYCMEYPPLSPSDVVPSVSLETDYTGVLAEDLTTVFKKCGLHYGLGNSYLESLNRQLQLVPIDSGLTTKVASDLRSGIYDILTDIAEAKSTVQTIFSLVVRFVKAFIATKTYVVSLKRDPQRVADAWLEFRYGVAPIIYSLNDAADWLNSRGISEYASFRGTSVTNYEFFIANHSCTIPVINRCFGKARVDNSWSGLKINPIGTALELVPLSFLLNWVCNIGDLLSSLWPPQGTSDEQYSYSRQVPKGIYVFDDEHIDTSFYATFGSYQIQPLGGFPPVAFELSYNMSLKRWLDALALAWAPLRKAAFK